ncbi:MAG TPA: hypothetical protein VLT58_06820 [Polyangia bacterium]|nr:hypothetical protein [Polyangia bacterium]
MSVVSGLLAIGWGAVALADEGEMSPSEATSPVLDPMAPSSLMAGPSLRETGRVGVMPEASAPAESLNPGAMTWAGQPEKSVQPVAAGFATAPPPRPPAGTIDPMLLNRELAANLAKVEDCRIEVARARQVPPAQVAAEPLVLRWTIQPTGEARTRDVLASALTDQDIVSCAKATMSQWRFTPPRGGSMDVERTVSFKGQ